VGILTRNLSETIDVFPNDATNWEFFNENRNEILDLVTPSEFLELYTSYKTL
jgi:hypothetical protein